jgi:hypothetical protein
MKHELTNKLSEEASHEQLETFTSALFLPEDLVEIRAIRRMAVGDKADKVVWRTWERPEELLRLHGRLSKHNAEKANIYCGVNPRWSRDGTKSAIRQVRCLWADIDNVTPGRALSQLGSGVPEPSICVSSGHGAHLYWLLDTPYEISSRQDRVRLESLLRNLYRDIGSDATQDVTRLLRLPGFNNVKRAEVPCELVNCDPRMHYDFHDFDRWLPDNMPELLEMEGANAREENLAVAAQISEFNLREFGLNCDCDDVARLRKLLERLDRPVADRSRRDFAIVCQLLRLGVTPAAISQLVDGHSKFTTSGYTQSTVTNAVRAVFG